MGIIQRYIYIKYSIFGHVYVGKKNPNAHLLLWLLTVTAIWHKNCVFIIFFHTKTSAKKPWQLRLSAYQISLHLNSVRSRLCFTCWILCLLIARCFNLLTDRLSSGMIYILRFFIFFIISIWWNESLQDTHL